MNECAEALRNFIEHFFGCEVCRVNFLQEYEDCSFQRCDRLRHNIGTLQDWKELPLWLFEFHNGVNVRLLKERALAAAHGTRNPALVTAEEVKAVEWPDRNTCPTCWHGDGRFDPDRVYMFLHLIYWPDELISQSLMTELIAETITRREATFEEEEGNLLLGLESWVYSLAGLVLASFVLSAASWAHKKKEIKRTGMHKKKDDPNYNCN
jgi:hypothetical protein